MQHCVDSLMQSLLAIAVDVCSGVQKPIISVARVFLRKMLGTRYGPVWTRFL